MTLQKIFFSYSRTDFSNFVLKLALDLKKEGFDVWIDQEDIRAGSEWDLEIEKALETCDCLLFIQSKNSVASNNALDEVYYALEQRKRVIPIIMQESKTPFRIKRLNYIDFTAGYEAGLTNLVNELKGNFIPELSQLRDGKDLKKSIMSYFTKSARLILLSSILVVIAAAAIIYSLKDKKETENKPAEIVTLKESTTDSNAIETEPKEGSKIEDPIIRKAVEKKTTAQKNSNPVQPVDKVAEINETIAGDWELVDVEPKARSKQGYLKIEITDEKKVNIRSTFQFHYFKTNDTAFLSIFNGVASCSSCPVKNEMKIIGEDISIGAQEYKIVTVDQPGQGKVRDTTLSAGSNKSIRASVTLHFINEKTALIKVQRSDAVPLSNGIVMAPFVYSFRFTKLD